MPQDSEALDLSVMDQLLDLDGGESGLLEEMAELFREDTPDRILGMAKDLGKGELRELSEKAHAVKGAASTMGAPRVRDLAAILEKAGREGDTSQDLAALIKDLQDRFREAMGALDAYIAGLKAS